MRQLKIMSFLVDRQIKSMKCMFVMNGHLIRSRKNNRLLLTSMQLSYSVNLVILVFSDFYQAVVAVNIFIEN